jgi:N-acetylglucosamine malate deacetylase 1
VILPPGLVRFAARHRRRLPTRVAGVAVELTSLVSPQVPLLVLPSVRRALVVAPHPDDESIGCGGTIARLTRAGTRVDVLLVTDGEATIGSAAGPAETARRRRGEAIEAAQRLGARAPIALALPDGAVAGALGCLVAALETLVVDLDPDVLLVPWPLEAHRDHRAITAALVQLPHEARRAEVWGYEAHTPIPLPDRVVDITDVVETKRVALRCHATAAGAFDLEACLGLARWRSLATRAGAGAAEAFLTLEWDELDEQVRLAARAYVDR